MEGGWIAISLIDCRHVSFVYDGMPALRDVNFQVGQGDYLCILGENGAGKSTLMKGILRLKKPSEGLIRFGDGLVRNQIGYLPQQTIVQKDFPASVYEVVQSGCLNRLGLRPFYGQKEKKRALENLEKLGMLHLQHRCYRELSGGQQQRVLLARALCATEKLMLLDEPTAGLDPVVTQELYQLIRSINRDMGITVIMVSHDVEGPIRDATHVLHLQQTQRFFGTAQDYVASMLGQSFLRGNNA